MTAFKAVYKRELKGYFGTLLSYVFLVAFLFASSFWAFKNGLFDAGDASLTIFFTNLPYILAVMAPALTMKMWAEEHRTGTIELLFTLPITVKQAVLAKFLAGWTFFLFALLLTAPLPIWIINLGDPDIGAMASGYFGASLIAACTLAVGSFVSATTKNQVISFIIATLICMILIFANKVSAISALGAWLPTEFLNFIKTQSLMDHYELMKSGVLHVKDIFYLVVMTLGFLYCTNLTLEMKKA